MATAWPTWVLDKTDRIQGNLKCRAGSNEHAAATRATTRMGLWVSIPLECKQGHEWRLQKECREKYQLFLGIVSPC